MSPLSLLLVLPCAGFGTGAYPLSAQTRTFSIAHKPGLGIKPGEELLLFNYTPSAPGTHCVMQSWFTGSLPWPQFGDTLIRFYIDGEPQPSVSITVNNLVGLGDANASTTHEHVPAPWGNAHHGVVGVGGGRCSSRWVAAAEADAARPIGGAAVVAAGAAVVAAAVSSTPRQDRSFM